MHSSSMRGHLGSKGTFQHAKQFFYWPTLKKEVEMGIKFGDICQLNRGENHVSPEQLQSLPIVFHYWSHISMDFVEDLSRSESKYTMLVVVDKLTK